MVSLGLGGAGRLQNADPKRNASMTKHMPEAPAANRSKKGPGDHHEVGSDTTHENRPDDLNTSEQGRHRRHVREIADERFSQRLASVQVCRGDAIAGVD